ncbi:poly [ADP-ribose] polymerase tankyrase-like [Neocloeon triangulifer]|uniref:poly [ADP-ribose] polymerase tankyrase-like n=1 Tax=Neocloeon triangulifer TaxID=2078957 RepID=UPI00286F8D6B|nr:poly [ADP-ribose] polymerase tankyrase-like [Neocloeon triangulifer]XP_059470211.1 poly [ADP-ribose] polymerase tankyrase-like [Neocloeon triangulifer]
MAHGNWYNGIQLEALQKGSKDYEYVKDKMHSSICHDEVQSYDIEMIYRVNNKYIWPRYKKRREQMSMELGGKWVEEKRLFHGSPQAEKIAKEGFDQGFAKTSGMFGKGVYFAEHSSKSNNYAFGCCEPCPRHKNRLCEICTRSMLLCKVALGRVYNATQVLTSLPHGYHSIKAKPQDGFLLYPEYIIYNDDQVYPRFLIEYTANFKHTPTPESSDNSEESESSDSESSDDSDDSDSPGVIVINDPYSSDSSSSSDESCVVM